MTAPTEVRTAADRLTLVARLNRLAGYVQRVADGRRVDAGFARALLEHLTPIVADAEVQSDQVEIYRAEAADREHVREALQSTRRDLQRLVDVVESLEPDALSKSWLIERLTGTIGRLDESLKPRSDSWELPEFSTDTAKED